MRNSILCRGDAELGTEVAVASARMRVGKPWQRAAAGTGGGE